MNNPLKVMLRQLTMIHEVHFSRPKRFTDFRSPSIPSTRAPEKASSASVGGDGQHRVSKRYANAVPDLLQEAGGQF
jgi:hypothetical protein